MGRIPESKRAPESSITRTNRDWIMIALGVFLALLFVVAGYTSYTGSDTKPSRKIRGPVKDPKPTSSLGQSNRSTAVIRQGDRPRARFHTMSRTPGFRLDRARVDVRSTLFEEQWRFPHDSDSGRATGVVDSSSGLQACIAPAGLGKPTAHAIPAKRGKPFRRAYGEIHAVT